MCGIAGWYRRGGRPVERTDILRQCDSIRHRGPDDGGAFTDRDFGFGMRRLSIVDIAGGRQPMATADGRLTLVFNGQIYNHDDLRRTLESKGTVFATRSDTEVLLQACAAWGDEAWPRLDGMFAAALWDAAARRLVLARDPLGIKPLYVTEQQGGLAFASEIRALRPLPGHEFDIDERAAHDYFRFGHVQRPRSIYRQVRSLEPGHILHLDVEGPAREQRYWQPRFAPRQDLSETAWIEETRARLDATVRSHLQGDVPVGAFLSGGVDSAALVAAMARSGRSGFKTFTLGFPGSPSDEAAAAERIARHVGAEHHAVPLLPEAAGEILPAVQSAFDEPTAATAAVPVWYLSRHAAAEVKVVLCGEGSDEIFAGYKRQRTALDAHRLRHAAAALAPAVAALAHLPGSSARAAALRSKSRRFAAAAGLANNLERFFAGTEIASAPTRSALYAADFHARQEAPSAYRQLVADYFTAEDRARHPLDQFMLADLTVHMPGSLLPRLDRASMAHSLEARVPFLSSRFVDWSLTMPRSMKLRGRTGKYALRQAIAPWLPSDTLSRRKLGFQLPFNEWFRGDFSRFAQDAWMSSGARHAGFLNPSAVDRLFHDHRTGTADHGRLLFALAMFGCWWDGVHSAPAVAERRYA